MNAQWVRYRISYWIRFVCTGLVAGIFACAAATASEPGAEAYPLEESAPLSAAASAPPAVSSGPALTQTEQWLRIQAGGHAASARTQEATALERELSMQRLLESYQHPIPMFFDQDEGGDFAR